MGHSVNTAWMKEWIFYSGEQAEEQPRQRTINFSCYSNAHIGTIFAYTRSPLQDLEMLFSLSCSLLISCSPPGPQPENKFPYSSGSTTWWGLAWLLGCISQRPVCWAPSLAQTSDHWFPLRPVQIGLWVIQHQTTSCRNSWCVAVWFSYPQRCPL